LNEIAARRNSGREAVDLVYRFVQENHHLPGFGIAFNVTQTWFKGVPVLSSFFHRYENTRNPSHVMVLNGPWAEIIPIEEYLKRTPKTEQPIFRELVKLGDKYHVFCQNGRFQGVLYEDDCWELTGDATTVAEAETLAEAALKRHAGRLSAAQ